MYHPLYMMEKYKFYIGSDHAGFDLKENVKLYLDNNGHQYQDLGIETKDTSDYPDVAFKVGKKVSQENNALGILICGTGIGMEIAANKVNGIRASVIYDKYSAIMSRKHDDVNIACLRAREMSHVKNLRTLRDWINSVFDKKKEHKRRIEKIKRFESKK